MGLFGTTAIAQPAIQPHPQLEKLLAPLVDQHDVPALAGAIVTADGGVRIAAVGLRRRGSPETVTVRDRFHIGSCGKALTATLLARLVERGTLAWSTTIAGAFPELGDEIHADFRSVTLEQLLQHRGGAPQNLNREGLWGKLWQRKGTPAEQRMELVRGVVTKAPAKKPGAEFEYSNAGYAIAGAIAERVTKTSFEELIRRELFEPLGMTSAGFGAPGVADKLDEPRGHATSRPVEPGPLADNPPAIAPAGTMHCALGDWAKFVVLHLAARRADTPLLKKQTVEKLHQPPEENGYAFGWDVEQRPWGGTVLTHAGSNTMWFCVVWMAPEKGFAVLAATNCGTKSAPLACDAAAWALIQHHLEAAGP
jgi:CubicO group peptidase (beta-lactamase class C family)